MSIAGMPQGMMGFPGGMMPGMSGMPMGMIAAGGQQGAKKDGKDGKEQGTGKISFIQELVGINKGL